MNLETPTVRREYARRRWSLRQNLAQENLLQINDAADHAPLVRGDLALSGSRKKWVELLEHATLGHRTNDFCFDLTLGEQKHGGNTHDIETTGDVTMIVNIEFRDNDLASLLCSNLFKDGCNLLARSTPFSPEVHQDGSF
jgi:hypothetical protein